MKKFISYISRQVGSNLKECIYSSDNPKLQLDIPIHYPIIAAINGYTEKDEEIEIILLHGEHESVKAENFEVFQEDLKKICQEKPLKYSFQLVEIPERETAEQHLNTFMKLMDLICDNDKLHVCCTYGSKVIPILEMLTLNFAHRNRKNTSVECIIYGRFDHKRPDVHEIYDLSALFYMMQITNEVAFLGTQHPEERVKQILEQALDNDPV